MRQAGLRTGSTAEVCGNDANRVRPVFYGMGLVVLKGSVTPKMPAMPGDTAELKSSLATKPMMGNPLPDTPGI